MSRPRPFASLAAGRCPTFDRMLLAVAAEFREVDHGGALNELDSLSLPLFGAASLPVRDRLRLMAAELGGSGRPACRDRRRRSTGSGSTASSRRGAATRR